MQTFRKINRAVLAACLALLALFCSTAVLPSARAANDVSATAELSQAEIDSGEMAELQVHVTGTEVADVPHEIAVDGLQIRLTGQSTQVQIVNFKVSSSVVYSYVVMPLRTGKFTIPAIPIRSNAGILRTSPVTLSVVDGSGGSSSAGGNGNSQPQGQPSMMPGFSQPPAPAPQPANHDPDTSRLAFGEISCAKRTIYAGEMVPVEIRYYFDAHYPVQVRGKVDFESEGIIVERFPDPKESRVERDGNTYNVLTFRTLLSAVQPGSIDIPAAKLDSQIEMPGPMPPGFDNPVFQQMLGGQNPFNQSRDITVKTAPLHLDILPLPKEGRPASFAGAVGEFDIDATVANPKLAPGDPADLTVKIGGKGNFNAMGAPVLTETEGWRTYPPSDKFEGSDEQSLTGVKTFDFTLIAQEPKSSSPGVAFSFFNPVTAKYETLTAKPIPLEASPGNIAASGAASSATAAATPVPSPSAYSPATPFGTPKQGDPLPFTTLLSWKTPVQRSEFLIANISMLVAAAALAGILRYYRIQQEGGNASSRRRRRVAEVWATLNSEQLDAAATYDAALEYASLTSAEGEARDSVMEAITARRDMLRYGFGRSVALSGEERKKLIETLRNLPSANDTRR